MKQEIAITVKDKIAQTDFDEVVSFNSVYRLKFDFDEEWEEYPARVAVVMWAGGAAEKLFTGTECEMPQIDSYDADVILIGVYSRLGAKRIASSFVRVRCETGAGGVLSPKPTLSLHEQVLSFLNEKDWSVFEEKIAEGVYSAVRVDPMGFVKEGFRIVEVGQEGQSAPSEQLAAGGIFFRKSEGVYTPCYFDGEATVPLSLAAGKAGKALTIGEKRYDGSADVTVGASDLGLAAVATSGSYNDLSDKPAPGGVTSVNGKTGAVTVSKFDLDLAEVAISGSYTDLKDKPELSEVMSVNGQTGAVVLDAAALGLSAVAASGSYNDLTDKPSSGVNSVNGQTGEVTVSRESLGLGALAERDKVQKGDYTSFSIATLDIAKGAVIASTLGDRAVTERAMHDNAVTAAKIAAGAVTGEKLDENVIRAGNANITVTRDGSSNFIISSTVTTGVTSLNGMTGDVTLDQEKLGLSDLAYSGNYKDLVGAPESGVLSVNGLTGTVVLDKDSLGLADIAVSGSFLDLKDAPESGVLSVNGKTGNVTVDAESLSLAEVAKTGSFDDLIDKPKIVNSFNGLDGEVTVTRETLGLGVLAERDKVAKGDYALQSITGTDIYPSSLVGSNFSDRCITARILHDSAVTETKINDGAVTEKKIAEGAVTGAKLSATAIKAGDNVTVTKDEKNEFVVSTVWDSGVSSVNGQKGDVTVSKESLGLTYVTSERQMPLAADSRNGVDFNTLFPNGFYNVNGTDAEPCVNFPVSAKNLSGSSCRWFLLVMTTSDNSFCTQVAFSERDDNAVRIRNYSDGKWGAWKAMCE